MNSFLKIQQELTVRPGLYCAQCNQPITNASEAAIVYKVRKENPENCIETGMETIHERCGDAYFEAHPCGKNECYNGMRLDAGLLMILSSCNFNESNARQAIVSRCCEGEMNDKSRNN